MARARRSKSSTTSRRRSQSRSSNHATLRTLRGDVGRIPFGPGLQNLAMKWNYIVSNRSRWSERPESRDDIAQRATDDLASLGIRTPQLRRMAEDQIVEVAIPYHQEDVGWEARIMPWEYLLSAATRAERGAAKLVVVRHLARGGRSAKRQLQSLSIVASAPGVFEDRYDFQGEVNLIRGSFFSGGSTVSEPVFNPTRKSLAAALQQQAPDVVHLTGVDTHLGADVLKSKSPQPIVDGLLLRGEREAIDTVPAVELAALLTAGSPPPKFVGFNCWNSADRVAPLTIAAGVGAAIGIQRTMDDALAELFFVNFYRNWRETDWNLLGGFLQAFESLRPYHERMRGTSIVLWSDSPLLELLSSLQDEAGVLRADDVERIRGEGEKRAAKQQESSREAMPGDDIRNLVQVIVQIEPQLNYALLHNQRSIVKNFALHFNVHGISFRQSNAPPIDDSLSQTRIGAIRDIQVEIVLHVGTDSFPYRSSITLEEKQPILNFVADSRGDPGFSQGDGIRVPLTSALARSIDERMQTSLYINVQWRDQILYRHTHVVSLQPVDEWMLDDRDISWIPSFVQPRDPGVAKIISSAQKYLKCLADYLPAGFDGYQSFDPDGKDVRQQWRSVDSQVQAIWHALVLDHPLGYINPPPSYREAAQRLRTPGQILSQGRGTCVDLAILMTSCLEWIEVYPVLFMLDDHAFPGYWRSEIAYNKFLSVSDAQVAQAAGNRRSTITEPWISDRSTYLEIKKYVNKGLLVPMETVSLTTPSGFQEAVDEATSAYFSNVRNGSFHSMINIARARESGVTPLPLCSSNS